MSIQQYMPKLILVALDGSSVAEAVLPQAVAHAQAFDAELVLLQVVPSPLLNLAAVTGPEPERDEPPTPEEQAASAYLEAIAANLRQQEVRVTCRVRRGSAAPIILEEAARTGLLLIANRGAGLLPRLLLGSVVSRVLPSAPCPVLLVPVEAKSASDSALYSFGDAVERYGPLVQRPLGLRTVPIERIVGSVGRAEGLRADFMPSDRMGGDSRFKRILKAMERGEPMPPVDLYKLGYDYYVLDGHHRVAAARARGQLEIDAVVTEFLALDNADVQRVFLERRAFEQATGLTRIGAARPGHYRRLQEMIEGFAKQHDISDLKEAAAQWYAQVYEPMVEQLRAARLASSFPGERNADLVVHVDDLRREEEQRLGRPVSWQEALPLIVERYRSSRRHARLRLPNLRQMLQRS